MRKMPANARGGVAPVFSCDDPPALQYLKRTTGRGEDRADYRIVSLPTG